MRTLAILLGRILLIVSALLLVVAPAYAIQDSNSNGMSDVWERHFNGNNLFIPSNPAHAALADPDKDGWTNTDEAVSGTNPFNPNAPTGRVIVHFTEHPASPGLFVVSWPTLVGKGYQMKVSTDLQNWISFDTPVTGTGGTVEIAFDSAFSDGSIPDALFLRVVILDSDTDGDTLTDAEELALGLNVNSPDTDLDGIPDGSDPAPGNAPNSSATLADPDGCNVPTGLATSLEGFWDFEDASAVGGNFSYADRSGKNRPATGEGSQAKLGMPSMTTRFGPAYLQVPKTVTQGKSEYTVSGWFKLGEGQIRDSSNNLFYTIFAVFDLGSTGPSPNYVMTGQGNGLFVRKTSGGGETWMVGGYQQTYHWNEAGFTNGNPKTVTNGYEFTLPAGTTDDGRWHHFVVTQGSGSTGQCVYLDGQLKVSKPTLSYGVSYDSDTYFSFGRLHPSHDQKFTEAYIDRLRVHSRVLSSTDAQSLYKQDIDRDGLWDITEVNTLLWRDVNSNLVREPEENVYLSSPYLWQPLDTDTDGDGATDIEEQEAGLNAGMADSDGDGMPDGWELKNGLNPKLATDATWDNDVGGPDGLANIEEYLWNTNPRKQDTDGDGKKDGPEVADGGDPNDSSDNGSVPAAKRFSVKLGVGDRSGSKSETYYLHCYRLDPATGQERRIYTLRPTPTGSSIYKEETKAIFQKGETYTFQIDWQNTTNLGKSTSPKDGADFDYHLVIQPQGSDHGTTLVDSYDPKTGQIDSANALLDPFDVSPTSDDDDNVESFLTTHETKRVALVSLKVEWESIYSDAELTDHVDPWTNQVNGKAWFPDSPDPTNPGYRDVVGVRVSRGLPKAKIWLRSFDVDDTTDEDFDTDSAIIPSKVIDRNGTDGADNSMIGSDVVGIPIFGRFIAQRGDGSGFGRYSGILGNDGGTLAKIRLGITPGNNYRIAATLKSSEELESLHVRPSTGASNALVSANSSTRPTLLVGEISPTLTIWRHLWLEIDTMKSDLNPPTGEENWIHGNVTSIASGTPIPTEPSGSIPAWDCVFSGTISRSLDEFGNGWLINRTTGTSYRIADVVKWPTGQTVIRTFSSPAGTGQYTLLDDDNSYLPPAYDPMLPRYGINYSYVASKFRTSFIQLMDASAYNPRKEIPFKLNEESVGFPTFLPISWLVARDLEDSKNTWVAHAIFGFQGSTSADDDPNYQLGDSGHTPYITNQARAFYSVIWLEQIRETFNANWYSSSASERNQGIQLLDTEINLTVAHEIGHQPSSITGSVLGLDHEEQGIMSAGGNSGTDADFSPQSVWRFRNVRQWTDRGEF